MRQSLLRSPGRVTLLALFPLSARRPHFVVRRLTCSPWGRPRQLVGSNSDKAAYGCVKSRSVGLYHLPTRAKWVPATSAAAPHQSTTQRSEGLPAALRARQRRGAEPTVGVAVSQPASAPPLRRGHAQSRPGPPQRCRGRTRASRGRAQGGEVAQPYHLAGDRRFPPERSGWPAGRNRSALSAQRRPRSACLRLRLCPRRRPRHQSTGRRPSRNPPRKARTAPQGATFPTRPPNVNECSGKVLRQEGEQLHCPDMESTGDSAAGQ